MTFSGFQKHTCADRRPISCNFIVSQQTSVGFHANFLGKNSISIASNRNPLLSCPVNPFDISVSRHFQVFKNILVPTSRPFPAILSYPNELGRLSHKFSSLMLEFRLAAMMKWFIYQVLSVQYSQ